MDFVSYWHVNIIFVSKPTCVTLLFVLPQREQNTFCPVPRTVFGGPLSGVSF